MIKVIFFSKHKETKQLCPNPGTGHDGLILNFIESFLFLEEIGRKG